MEEREAKEIGLREERKDERENKRESKKLPSLNSSWYNDR